VGALRSFLKENSPTTLSDREISALIEQYWKCIELYKIHEDVPLLFRVLSDRSNRRQNIVATGIALGSLMIALIALILSFCITRR
jgi:hypothetical protein